MSMKIESSSGRDFGKIEDRGNKLEGLDRYGNTVGYYEKGRDRTTDRVGNDLFRGDSLSYLIVKANL